VQLLVEEAEPVSRLRLSERRPDDGDAANAKKGDCGVRGDGGIGGDEAGRTHGLGDGGSEEATPSAAGDGEVSTASGGGEDSAAGS
jgi:hypothetical protein